MSAGITDLLELFEQPAFLAKDDSVVWRNTAASSLVEEGMPLQELLKEKSSLFELWDGTGVLNLPLEFQNAGPCDVSVRSCPEGCLFVVTPRKKKSAAMDTALLLSSAASLRRPLQHLLSSAGALFEALDPEQLPDAASELNRSIYQLVRLSAQISDGVPLLLNQKKAIRTPVRVGSFFDHFVSQVQPLMEASGHRFRYIPLEKPLTIDMDAALVERALFNLISNALTYSAKGSTVSLVLHLQEKQLLVSVSDTGEGISPRVIATLFERYASRPIGDSRWGLGLGLPMVREIARLHDGTMMVCSGEEEKGTTAVFSLSVKPASDLSLHSPLLDYDYCSGLNHALVELSDCLDKSNYHPDQV